MYKRILLAYDGSVEGRTALREGALLARQCGAEVFLLSALVDPGTFVFTGRLFRWKMTSLKYLTRVLPD